MIAKSIREKVQYECWAAECFANEEAYGYRDLALKTSRREMTRAGAVETRLMTAWRLAERLLSRSAGSRAGIAKEN